MPSQLQIRAGAGLLIWLLGAGFVLSARRPVGGSLSASCRPSYRLLLPLARTTALILGCRDSLSSLPPDRLKTLSSAVAQLLSEGKLDEGSLPSLNRLVTDGKNDRPILNVVVAKRGRWIPISPSSRMGIVEISGEEASALIVARRELLGSLQTERRALADALDRVMRRHEMELFSLPEDPQLRDEIVKELLGFVKDPDLLPAGEKSEGKIAIDLFITAGRIGESL
jgi:hypothetical protein